MREEHSPAPSTEQEAEESTVSGGGSPLSHRVNEDRPPLDSSPSPPQPWMYELADESQASERPTPSCGGGSPVPRREESALAKQVPSSDGGSPVSRREEPILADASVPEGETPELPRGVWRPLPPYDDSEESKKAWRQRLRRMPKIRMRVSNRLPHFEHLRGMQEFHTPCSMPAVIDTVNRAVEWVSITSYSYDHPGLHAVLLRLLAQDKRVRFLQSREYWYKCGVPMAARLLDLFNAGAEFRFWKGHRHSVRSLHMKSIVVDGAVAIVGSQNWTANSEEDCVEGVWITQILSVVAPLFAHHHMLASMTEYVTQFEVDQMRQRARNFKAKYTPRFLTPEERYAHDISFVGIEAGIHLTMGPRTSPGGDPLYVTYRAPHLNSSTCREAPLFVNPAFNPPSSYESIRANVRAKGMVHEYRYEEIPEGRLTQVDLLEWARKYKKDVAQSLRDRGITYVPRGAAMLQDEETILQLPPLPPVEEMLAPGYAESRQRLVLDGEGVSSEGSTTSVEEMHPADADTSVLNSKMSRLLRCQKRPDPRGGDPQRSSIGVQASLGSTVRRKAWRRPNAGEREVGQTESIAYENPPSVECASGSISDGGSPLSHPLTHHSRARALTKGAPAPRSSGNRQSGQCNNRCEFCHEFCRWVKHHKGERHLCFQCEQDFPPPDQDTDSDFGDSISELVTTDRPWLSQSSSSSAPQNREADMRR